MSDIYEDYAILDAEIGALEAKKQIMRVEILNDMVSRGVTKEKHALGGFSVFPVKSWEYPEAIVDLAGDIKVKVAKLNEKVKTAKAKAESDQTATYSEVNTVRFSKIKI